MVWPKILAVIFLFYFAFFLFLILFQDKLLFYPSAWDFFECSQLKSLGANPKEVVWRDLKIRYYQKSSPGHKALLLIFHGNAGNVCDRAFFLQDLSDLPLDIVLAEYPGYSDDGQKISEKTIFASALGIYDHLINANGRDQKVLVFGESLGSGVALYLAANRKVEGLILQSPYVSISELGSYHYPLFPTKYFMKNPFRADLWAGKVTAPTLILHGLQDEIIPLEMGRKLSGHLKTSPQLSRSPGRAIMIYLLLIPTSIGEILRNFLGNSFS